MRFLHTVLTALLASTLAHGALGFSKSDALRRSESLLDAQRNESWELFQRGFETAKAGDRLGGALLIRAGLKINPADVQMHILAASLFEASGAEGYALAHWDAARTLAETGTAEYNQAQNAVLRVFPRLGVTDDRVQCKILGDKKIWYQSMCDDPAIAFGPTPRNALKR